MVAMWIVLTLNLPHTAGVQLIQIQNFSNMKKSAYLLCVCYLFEEAVSYVNICKGLVEISKEYQIGFRGIFFGFTVVIQISQKFGPHT